MTSANRTPAADPGHNRDVTRSPIFRILLLVQVAAAGLFGVVPLLLPELFAALTGAPGGPNTFISRLAGAATLGYAVVALVGFVRPSWTELRIPLVATFTFTLCAATGSLLTLDEGDVRPVVLFVLLAGSAFAALAAWWLARSGADDPSEDERIIESGFRLTLMLATGAALSLGIASLLLTASFARAVGLSAFDLFIYRMAGAATLGYGVAGVFQLASRRWRAIRLQNLGAIVFSAVAAISAAIYLATRGTSPLPLIVLLGAGFFTFALTWWAARAQR